MKKLLLGALSLLLLVGLAVPVQAQFEWLPKAGITPDSPFYFFDQMGEKIGMSFTFSKEAKIKKALKNSEERLSEIKSMIDNKKTKGLEKATEGYYNSLESAQGESKELSQQEREKVAERVASSTSKHLSVLEGVLDRVPEETRESITKAKESSKRGHLQSLESLFETKPEEAINIGSKSLNKRAEKVKNATATDRIQEAMKNFDDLNRNFQSMATRTDQVKVKETVGRNATHHLEVLEGVLDKVPEEAKESIQRAMEVSQKGRERAMEALQKSSDEDKQGAKEALERVRENIPERAREKRDRSEDETDSGVVSECEDNECEWVSVNCCPENAGAEWECVNKAETDIDCPDDIVCPQVISEKPTTSCECIEGECQGEKEDAGSQKPDTGTEGDSEESGGQPEETPGPEGNPGM